jgi:membrane fusion protein, multidrug efflux system
MDKCLSASGEVSEFDPTPGLIALKERVGSRRRLHLRLRFRTVVLMVGAMALMSVAAIYGTYWWHTGRFLVSTDDAYVDAHSVLISPQVSGYLVSVYVGDNQKVRAGQILARIDSRLYHAAVDRAQANVHSAQAGITILQQQVTAQRIAVGEARAAVQADVAALGFAREQNDRYAALSRNGAAAIESSQQWQARIREAGATLTRDTAGVALARQKIAVLGATLDKARATLRLNQAALEQADLDLGYTTIRAPIAGTVGDRTLRVGQYVQAGMQLMAIVPLSAVYVTANYKETQLTNIRPGQKATIAVDSFPGVAVHGQVNSIAPASGEQFALLPPDNATGNFTKIVQRVPVKISIDTHNPLLGMLRPGMSVEPTIDTRHG